MTTFENDIAYKDTPEGPIAAPIIAGGVGAAAMGFIGTFPTFFQAFAR